MKTINRLLIANRGEIVVRIARTARRLGITTIAVSSDADRDSPHVAACDSYVVIGGLAPADSYLRIDKIMSAARSCEADAIHPGYGFLSENAAFAAAVEQSGLIFVGPPSSAIHAMGDKARARQRMAAAGVPVVPGYDGEDQSEERLRKEATRIGLPLMVKAAAGGGGRGMRLVQEEGQLVDSIRSAVSEASKSFGDGRLILERAIIEPRHVEIQVLADAHGNVIHLGERDCSIQRRHQKVVEEAPSPAVDPTLRSQMGACAVSVARGIEYSGAGTVEFLLDRAGTFYFMEMNTRLQVEHPVTELVTGLDLVELQLRAARGEVLPLEQKDVRMTGHAVEVRLCAEDPADDFLPRSGTVLDWNADNAVRSDHAVAVGMEVSPWYDSMLAKIIAFGSTRTEAIDRLAHALDRTSLLGVVSNRSFLGRILKHDAFIDGSRVSTAFIGDHFASSSQREARPSSRAWSLAAWLSVASSDEARQTTGVWSNWSTSAPLTSPWRLKWVSPSAVADNSADLRSGRLLLKCNGAEVNHSGTTSHIVASAVAPRTVGHFVIDGIEEAYRYVWEGSTLWIHVDDGDYAFVCQRRESAAVTRSSAGTGGEVRSRINGRVIEVAVVIGQAVEKGQRLITLEAMKMEQQVLASVAGKIAQIAIQAGDQVAPGQTVIRIDV